MVRPARAAVRTGRLWLNEPEPVPSGVACQHARPGTGELHREQADERGKNDQDLDDADLVPHLKPPSSPGIFGQSVLSEVNEAAVAALRTDLGHGITWPR
jgi:hypothetical protein